LTHSGRLTQEVVTRQPWIRRRSGKVRQLLTDVLTTEPRRQLVCSLWWLYQTSSHLLPDIDRQKTDFAGW